MPTYSAHPDNGALLGEVLNFLVSGTRVPDDIALRLGTDNALTLRALETSISSNRTWRIMSVKLLEVSQMLTAGRESTEVLGAIVQHARSIIGADVSYISLNDETTGFTNVLNTTGVVTSQFRDIRMPIGSGVLGIVAATNRPAWTHDHANDPAVTHVDYVDEAVAVEGIRAILGAPIHLSGKTIGALLVGDRRPRHYTREEIQALELLGSMAAVALDTAQVIESQGESVAELTRSQIALTERVSQLQKLADVDKQLLEVMTGKAQFSDLVGVLSTALDSPVWLWHQDTQTLHGSAPVPEMLLPTIQRLKPHQQISIQDSLSVLPVDFNRRFLGAICVARKVDDMQRRILTHASAAFTALALFHEALVQATARKVEDLVYSIALGRAEDREAQRLRQLTGIDIAAASNVHFVVFNSHEALCLPGKQALTRHSDHYCGLIQLPPELSIEKLEIPNVGSCVAAAPLSSLAEASHAHDVAFQFFEAATTLQLSEHIVTPTTLGTVGLILGSTSSALDLFVRSTLGGLIDYDTSHSTELEKTAYQFFLSGQSIQAAARALYVHPNTVRQRLERITALLGPHWARGSHSLDIHMALRVRALKKAM